MGFDLNKCYSHPGKLLKVHLENVASLSKVYLENVALLSKRITNSDAAGLVSLFHDIGKVNPNFQEKLNGLCPKGYDHHAYLSAYAFLMFLIKNPDKFKVPQGFNSNNFLTSLITVVAKHHGDLPDMMPNGNNSILSDYEVSNLCIFLDNTDIPFGEIISELLGIKTSEFTSREIRKISSSLAKKLVIKPNDYKVALPFYLEIQSIFSALIKADKSDAGVMVSTIAKEAEDLKSFSHIYPGILQHYLDDLNSQTLLNVERTKIRLESINSIRKGLEEGKQIFELTAPTGSGKTLMLLSLASEIIKSKGAKRIIYGLPFLSITEQVESEVLKILKGYEYFVQRIDSKSTNTRFDEIQKELDENPSEKLLQELEALEFQDDTFGYPFIITTFVRIFETLLGNKNHELMKLPNFSNCVFLLDEIQSLPPRLYGFFIAYLDKFCKLTGSFAIVSTATQPALRLPDDNKEAKEFFLDYEQPFKLLSLSHYENPVFNRYTVEVQKSIIDIEQLGLQVLQEEKSVLVILNTIQDTKDLYNFITENMDDTNVLLLNTHFTPRDRSLKIYLAKRKLRQGDKVVLISTQLIEAGVDIDFPVLYRDFATISSIVQSAGRCNRNGKNAEKGKVVVVRLGTNQGERSSLIYQGPDKELIQFSRESFCESENCEEKDMLNIQKAFFEKICDQLIFGAYGENLKNNLMEDISQCMYEKVGKFSLIDNNIFGEECLYYVPRNGDDKNFKLLLEYQKNLKESLSHDDKISIIRYHKRKLSNQLKKMSNRIVQIRFKQNQTKPITSSDEDYNGLCKISSECYNFRTGIQIDGGGMLL